MLNTADVGAQLSWAVISAYLIQALKGWNIIPLVNFDTKNINRLIAVIFAAITASGMTVIFNRSLGQLTITGISIVTVYHFISNTIQQFALQHAIYKGIIAPPLSGPVQEAIRKNGRDIKTLEVPVTVDEKK